MIYLFYNPTTCRYCLGSPEEFNEKAKTVEDLNLLYILEVSEKKLAMKIISNLNASVDENASVRQTA